MVRLHADGYPRIGGEEFDDSLHSKNADVQMSWYLIDLLLSAVDEAVPIMPFIKGNVGDFHGESAFQSFGRIEQQ